MKNKITLLSILFVLCAGCVGTVEHNNNAGNREYARQNFDDALRAYQLAQVNAPDHAVSYFNAGSAYVAVNDLAGAERALEQSLLTQDISLVAAAYYNLGNVYFLMSAYQEAILAYREVLLLFPDDEDARYNLELAMQRYVVPTPTALEQQTEPELGQSDMSVTPTNNPGGFDGPTPTPPPQSAPPNPSETPESGNQASDGIRSSTPLPQQDGELTLEQAERILDSIEQDQETLSQYLQDEATSGEPFEKDW